MGIHLLSFPLNPSIQLSEPLIFNHPLHELRQMSYFLYDFCYYFLYFELK
jgi:hypothetical protein